MNDIGSLSMKISQPDDDPDAVTIDILQDVARMIYFALTDMANDQTLTF